MPFLQKHSLKISFHYMPSIISTKCSRRRFKETATFFTCTPLWKTEGDERPWAQRKAVPGRCAPAWQEETPHVTILNSGISVATADGDAHTLPESWPGCIPVGYHTQQIGTTPLLSGQLSRTGVYKYMLYPPKLHNQPAAFLAWNDVSPIPIRWQIWLENVYYEPFQSVKIQIIVLSLPPWDTLSTWL